MRRKKENFKTKFKNMILTLTLVGIMFLCLQGFANGSHLKFAQISDAHFLAHGTNTTYKMTAEGPRLLEDAVNQINEIPNLDFVMFSGDLIDKPLEIELNAAMTYLEKINAPWYFTFGNHDICIGGYLTKSLYLNILRKNNSSFTFTTPYYSFVPKNGYKVIALDTIVDDKLTSNGNISSEQLKWLDEELNRSQKDVVLIFMHVPVLEPFNSPNHRLQNEGEVRTIIEKYKNPIGVFMGHYHAAKITQKNNVIYVNSPALISYPNSFRIISVNSYKNKVIFDITTKETRLKNIQKLAKLLVFGTTIYSGEPQDQNLIITIKR